MILSAPYKRHVFTPLTSQNIQYADRTRPEKYVERLLFKSFIAIFKVGSARIILVL